MDVKIKICGLFRECDADYVNQIPPDYTGFIFWPKSHRCVDATTALKIKDKLFPSIKTVGVFVDEKMDVISDIAKSGAIDIIQLHGGESEEDVMFLKESTHLPVIKAIKIKTGDELLAWQHSKADYLLFDSGYGTGKPFDWNKLSNGGKLFEDRKFFLAGGIGEDNIKQAVDTFAPYALDLSSSVETDKVKDPQKIRRVMEIVRGL